MIFNLYLKLFDYLNDNVRMYTFFFEMNLITFSDKYFNCKRYQQNYNVFKFETSLRIYMN